MPGRKLTALRYGSVSAISNRVTDVTCERSAGTRQRQQGKKCSKNLCRCRSCDIENGFDREDVFSERIPADVDRGRRAEWAAAARPDGRSNPLNRNGEHISYTALGLDDARRARVTFELAPQAKNLHVDAAIENIFMHARGVQQVLPAERALRRIEKGD